MFNVAIKHGETGENGMSEEGDTFFVNLAEKLLGLILVVLWAILIYLTATTSALGAFSFFFGILSFIMLIIGLFLLLVRASE